MRHETPQEVIDDIIRNSQSRYAKKVYDKNLRKKLLKQKRDEEKISQGVCDSSDSCVQLSFSFDRDMR